MACGLLNAPSMKKSLVLLVLLGACSLYSGNGDDVCNYGYGDDVAVSPAQGFVYPTSGQCEYIGGGGGYCDSACGPCPAETGGAAVADPDWPSCYTSCSGLGEADCEATAGCHADYNIQYTPSGQQNTFWQCVALPP